MNHAARQGVLASYKANGDYAERLVADLSPEEMTSQPVAGVTMNHPAWVLAHLAAYPPVLLAMIEGRTPDDPAGHQYGKNSRPLESASEYPPKDALVAHFLTVRHRLAEAFDGAEDDRIAGPVTLERWQERFPSIWHAAVHLMTTHEATHLGQLSAWRRAGGRPAV